MTKPWKLREDKIKTGKDVCRLITGVGQKILKSHWGIEPQTLGFHVPMLRWEDEKQLH